MRKSAFFDLDYTLYNGYTATNLTRFLTEHGYADANMVDEEVELQREYANGTIDYREAARRALQLNANAVRGKTEVEVATLLQAFIKEYNLIYPWAAELMEVLRSKDYDIYIISASMDFSVKTIADILGVDRYFGTTVGMKNGVYTGEMTHLLNFKEKHDLVQRLLAETAHEKHVGFGDSEGDIDMLEAMETAVVYNPKSQDLVSLATERGWFIANERNILDFARNSL